MIGHRPAVALRRGNREIAARVVREIEIGGIQPRTRRHGGNAEDRVHVQPEQRTETFHIFPGVEFDGRLAVPEQIVGHAHPGRDVLPGDPLRRARGKRDLLRHEDVVLTTNRVGRVVCEAVVPPQAALQRQPVPRPLILRVQVDGDDVAAGTKPAGIREVLRDLIRHAVVRPHLDDGAVVVVVLRRRAEPALVAELHVVRAADVRQGRPPFLRPDLAGAESAVREPGMPGDQARDRTVAARDVARLFELLNHQRIVDAADAAGARPAATALGVRALVGSDPRLRQQPGVDRERPGGLLDAGRFEERQARAVGRLRRRAAALGANVVVLFLPVERQLVASRRLPRQTPDDVLVERVRERRLRQVEIHHPQVRIVGVLVDPHARDRAVRPDLAVGHVEPELVPFDGAATHGIPVVQALQLRRRPQALVLERLRVVVALHPACRAVDEGGSSERVAAVLRGDVEDHPGALRFTEPAGHVDHHFRRAGRVQELTAGNGLAREIRVQSIGLRS